MANRGAAMHRAAAQSETYWVLDGHFNLAASRPRGTVGHGGAEGNASISTSATQPGAQLPPQPP